MEQSVPPDLSFFLISQEKSVQLLIQPSQKKKEGLGHPISPFSVLKFLREIGRHYHMHKVSFPLLRLKFPLAFFRVKNVSPLASDVLRGHK